MSAGSERAHAAFASPSPVSGAFFSASGSILSGSILSGSILSSSSAAVTTTTSAGRTPSSSSGAPTKKKKKPPFRPVADDTKPVLRDPISRSDPVETEQAVLRLPPFP
ncbi:uncharacterized protein [Oryza sativa Japonica Group]|uniref:Os09g0446000 protein n=2 Tax=Oryza sativa subsp. japonica TaxID=39947 RepID=Q0J1E5_ORYSJ|nr:uncharacterized protein LOC4347200 isoform X1 [Oryza sativa Japonica Group]KAB8110760.1 hypothetical protein EE612_048168 [Oryza sativa]EEE69816.1 hypothetical protein OsJ_29557 [Oryza sativa Japonica Group]KAF2916418.1 hypothetical protein DAI22_09g118200 [Oryza sativa Japonica Group]BAD38327.1 unknown protein [Oryza sativa Japonica Group]BAF25220.1 Os09g0446000 [Oryza sativa Japonica Group]|eukprot:NP_001063306.1 Os09g0446000 [Oryza sativa Japonica Group]